MVVEDADHWAKYGVYTRSIRGNMDEVRPDL